MKITKIGTKPGDRVWLGHCKKCGSEAEALQSQLHNIVEDMREGTQFSWEKCPVCGTGSLVGNFGSMIFCPKPVDKV